MTERARTLPTLRPVVIGVGNPYRSDDGVGIEVLQRLRTSGGDAARWETCTGEPTELLHLWDGAPLALVVDAVRSKARPGTIHRLVVGTDPVPPGSGMVSSHGVSLPDLIGLGRALGQIPHRLVLYGIEAVSFENGRALSPEVEEQVPELVSRVLSEVRAFLPGSSEAPEEEGAAHA